MFDIGSTELLLIVIIAVIVIGPKDLPRALYKVGQVLGKARGMARHFRTGIDAMVREVEVEELEKKWADQNKRIMQEHPAEPSSAPAMEPLATTSAAAAPVAEASPPPFVAQSAPAVAEPKPAAAADGPPYIAAQSATGKGDAPA
ncbi:Twin-arginine translocation protein TatB [Sphingobium herbicidovorans NBRC 16415]|jgi:sec-independent protein translocase protein TatB|uniref:Twin-arginine translocation protein TatB n=1 Tax=Sphingobium herbicidovorans (strain ATCC 700291 / DSM 11019 / CCUG 56400 / KCTC 2939 / LMG 18315 / NBRC 16415 / MH) TaxID=1219045 RepID=A0A086PE11_SPHHM|nr:Sec-independent protein translocase protein TatB [Sphingobium herbicidovorans]KFG91629.1 Twin-arginine translocation protein TatB [Sphingobium herbicidovorans NBRC 16415]